MTPAPAIFLHGAFFFEDDEIAGVQGQAVTTRVNGLTKSAHAAFLRRRMVGRGCSGRAGLLTFVDIVIWGRLVADLRTLLIGKRQ